MNDDDYVADKPAARNSTWPKTASEFATFRCLPDGNGGWLDPQVDVGVMVGSVLPSDQFAQFLAKHLA